MASPTPTKLIDLVRQVRQNLNEAQPRFWSDTEIFEKLVAGAKFLWKKIVDLDMGHFDVIDVTNVSLSASTSTLSGVPADCFRVKLIEPRDTSSAAGSAGSTIFLPKKYNSREMVEARTWTSQDVTSPTVIYYDLMMEGTPIAAPTVQVAPQISSPLTLRFVYQKAFPIVSDDLTNPIPGESDMALVAYATAFARAKLPAVGMPDPGWLEVFKAESQALITALTPRQIQEPEVAEGMFEDRW